MKRLRIIADDKIPFLKGILEDYAEIKYLPGAGIDSASVRHADALLIRTRTLCNETLLKGSDVKFIASATIGFDHIDTDYCKKNGIAWTNAPGCNASSVEQYMVSALLNLAISRKLILQDLTIGIIGVGSVGSKIARIAKALGMKVLLNDPPRALAEGLDGFDALEKIKKEADIISFHVPLNVSGPFKTLGMVDKSFIQGIKKEMILINTSRGEVVKESDLIEALNKKRLAAVVLDVWENEPEINTRLMNKADLVSPHIAGYSTDGKANGTMMTVRALSRYFELGLDNWKPEQLPLPENIQISVDCTSKNKYDIIYEVYKQCYNIAVDDELLRSDPRGFEEQRGNYRIRREPQVFQVKLLNNPWPGIESILENLGFTILSPNCFYEL
jgi:erythronate-4-phosphate dehydrogenase